MKQNTKKYILGIDQSTQGTKALLFDETGRLLARADRAHRQLIDEKGWVSHDGEEIYRNMLAVAKEVLEKGGAAPSDVAGIGISNQRETSLLWDRETGLPLAPAVVWQCRRAASLCEIPKIKAAAGLIRERTGLALSPYFPAPKIAWLLQNTDGAMEKAAAHKVCHGTVDSYLIYRLTKGAVYATDYSNASRTMLYDIYGLKWDEEICGLFGIEKENLPEILSSNACFGTTDFEGLFEEPVPIHAAMGDSHAALFGQNCRQAGMAKATYGTGSSIMMNTGDTPVKSSHGLVTSLAWGIDGRAEYVLEGNLNYTGAVITWLKDDVGLIQNPGETETLAEAAEKEDGLYLVPAFSGLGAPYWNADAKAMLYGMDRTTGKAEIVRAGLECIAYQIKDILRAMEEDQKDQTLRAMEEGQKDPATAGTEPMEAAQPDRILRVDGGPTKNAYLMQFQSDIARVPVAVPDAEELSGIGAAYLAGLALGVYKEEVFSNISRRTYCPVMDENKSEEKYKGWKNAVEKIR